MKILIVFYSFSWNTQRACFFLQERLKEAGHQADCIDLRPRNEEQIFLKQCANAAFKKVIPLLECKHDVSLYDMIVFASPVWAFTIAPALATYFCRLNDLESKKIACLVTYGSGVGAQRALRVMEASVQKWRGAVVFSKAISGFKTKQRGYLKDEFKPLLEFCGG